MLSFGMLRPSSHCMKRVKSRRYAATVLSDRWHSPAEYPVNDSTLLAAALIGAGGLGFVRFLRGRDTFC